MPELLAAAFGLAAVSTAVMAAINWRHRRNSSAYGVIAFMGAGVALVNALNFCFLSFPGRTPAIVILSASSVVQGIVTGSVLCMALALSDRAWRITRSAVLLLAIEPAVVLVFAVTNSWFHLLYEAATLPSFSGSSVPAPGPILLVHSVYGQLLIWGTAIRVFIIRRRASSPAQRLACTRVLITNLPPLIGAMLMPMLSYQAGEMSYQGGDLITIGQAVTMMYIQAVLVRALPRQIPVAHRQIFSAITDAVIVIDRDRRIIEVNPAGHALTHRLWPGLPDDLTGLFVGIFDRLRLDEKRSGEQILTNASESGIDLHLLINPLFDRRKACIGWALVARDITQSNRARREAEETAIQLREQLKTIEALQATLAEQATRDELTGLHNRRFLVKTLEHAVPGARDGRPLSLAIIDLDHFKDINDTFGHGAGDLVLVNVAHLLATTVRQDDVVARYGGEEFVIVFRGASAESAWSRTDALRELLLRTPVAVDGLSLSATFSAGVAELAPGGTAGDLLRAADAALYEAKRQGRNRVILAADGVSRRAITPRARSGYETGTPSARDSSTSS